MSNSNDIFGGDILLDENGQAVVAANGELVWTDGLTAAEQDIRLRILTRLKGLFYDAAFGSIVPDFIHENSTKTSRMSLAAEVKRRLELDPRVLVGSVSSKVRQWDERGVTLDVSWRFWDSDEPQNLTVTLTRPGAERVTKDVNLEHD